MGYKRRGYIIHKGLQMKITLSFVVISLLGSIIATGAFNFFALSQLEALMWSSHINVHDTGEIIRPLFIYINVFNFVFVSLLLTGAIIWMLRLKSGPIYRMMKDIMKIADGDLSSKITLRKKDEFQSVANELNRMAESLRERFTVLNDAYAGISASIGEIKRKTGVEEITAEEYDLILKDVARCEGELSKYKLRHP